ncbi:Bgh specific protein [Blumeria hordei DH14]|uniref:Bgh specific protein n=1 Tax=Blumeria graminis f. sp. hordei (strain DH14) TaxID=546991 RepID=N1JIR0_BLUG1|nr:Bgh specific protein [Blumeria hordei DH14]
MQCIFAFLLSPMQNSLYPERLVVASGDPMSLSYGVYENNVHGNFPHFSSSDVFMTQVKVTVPGTYVKLFCSFKLSGKALVEKVVKGLEDITHHSHRNFGTTSNMEDECLNSITKHAKHSYLSTTKSNVQKKRACTDLVLVNLASRGLIQLSIDQRPSYEPGSRAPIPVKAASKMSLRSVVPGDHFFKGHDLDYEEALAWYRGHLHVLRRDERDLPWYSVTSITPRPENGAVIIDFLLRNIQPFIAMSGDLTVGITTSKTTATEPTVKALKNLNLDLSNSLLRAAYCQKEILPLIASHPTGFMGNDLLRILEARRPPRKKQRTNEQTKSKFSVELGVS